MKFSSNKCDRIIDINKNSPFGEKKKKDILKTPRSLCSEAVENFEEKIFCVQIHESIGIVVHVSRLENLRGGMQILN